MVDMIDALHARQGTGYHYQMILEFMETAVRTKTGLTAADVNVIYEMAKAGYMAERNAFEQVVPHVLECSDRLNQVEAKLQRMQEAYGIEQESSDGDDC